MSPRGKILARKQASRKKARATLESIISGSMDAYEGYRKLSALYCANNEPMVRLPGIEPDGVFSVTRNIRCQIVAVAQDLLPLILN
jgi:hypothetical protein